MMGRRQRRRKQLLDALKEKIGHWKLKQEVPNSTLWTTGFEGGYVLVIRPQNE
jgi:hypothetical protein